MREENMERIGEEVRQLMEKLREKQLSHSLGQLALTPLTMSIMMSFALCLES